MMISDKEVQEKWWHMMSERGGSTEIMSEAGVEYPANSPEYMHGDPIIWDIEFSSSDRQKIINYAGGIDGMKENLVDAGWISEREAGWDEYGESYASEYTLEDLNNAGMVWDNSSIQERKKIIINTHNGYTEGHDNNIVKNWIQLDDHVRSNIVRRWDDAFQPFNEERKAFFGLTESYAKEEGDTVLGTPLSVFNVNDYGQKLCPDCGANALRLYRGSDINAWKCHDCNGYGYFKESNETKFGTLNPDGSLTNEMDIDLNETGSDDPLAYAFGFSQGKSGRPMDSGDDLAPEYIRGYNDGKKAIGEGKANEYSAKFERSAGSMKIGGKTVKKIWESFTGWYWYGIENQGNGTWYGYVQGFENEWGYFSEDELNSMKGQVWEVPKSNWEFTGRSDSFESYAREDALMKVEDEDDGETEVTVLDEWKGESWDRKTFNQKMNALEAIGFRQGKALRFASLAYEDFSEDMRKQLDNYTEEDADAEQESINQDIEESFVDYNNIGESRTARTKYECEFCNSGFKSNESLSLHYNDIHAVRPTQFGDYESIGNENWKDVANDLYKKEINKKSKKNGGESWDSWRCHNCGKIIPKGDAGKHREETGHTDIGKFKQNDPNDFLTWESYAGESDIVDGIIRAENGEMSSEELIEFVKENKDTLMQLQGSWQRTVQSVLDYIGESKASEMRTVKKLERLIYPFDNNKYGSPDKAVRLTLKWNEDTDTGDTENIELSLDDNVIETFTDVKDAKARYRAVSKGEESKASEEGFNSWYYSTNWDKNSPELNIDLKEKTLSYFGLPEAWAYLKWEDIPQQGKDKISSESKATEGVNCDYCGAKGSVNRDPLDNHESVICNKCNVGDDLYAIDDNGEYVYKELIGETKAVEGIEEDGKDYAHCPICDEYISEDVVDSHIDEHENEQASESYSDPECNICGAVIHNSYEQNDDFDTMIEKITKHYIYNHGDIPNVEQLITQQISDQENKTSESYAEEFGDLDILQISDNIIPKEQEVDYLRDLGISDKTLREIGLLKRKQIDRGESYATEDDYQYDYDELTSLAQDKLDDEGVSQDEWDGSSEEEKKDIENQVKDGGY